MFGIPFFADPFSMFGSRDKRNYSDFDVFIPQDVPTHYAYTPRCYQSHQQSQPRIGRRNARQSHHYRRHENPVAPEHQVNFEEPRNTGTKQENQRYRTNPRTSRYSVPIHTQYDEHEDNYRYDGRLREQHPTATIQPVIRKMEPEAAAAKIQQVYRGWAVRKSGLLAKLKTLGQIRAQAQKYVQEYREGHKKRVLVADQLTGLLCKIDSISGRYVRPYRKQLVRDVQSWLAEVEQEKEQDSRNPETMIQNLSVDATS